LNRNGSEIPPRSSLAVSKSRSPSKAILPIVYGVSTTGLAFTYLSRPR
jgi:hypothetical protein